MPLHTALHRDIMGLIKQTLSWIMMQTVPGLQPLTCSLPLKNTLKRQTRVKGEVRRRMTINVEKRIMIGKTSVKLMAMDFIILHPSSRGDGRSSRRTKKILPRSLRKLKKRATSKSQFPAPVGCRASPFTILHILICLFLHFSSGSGFRWMYYLIGDLPRFSPMQLAQFGLCAVVHLRLVLPTLPHLACRRDWWWSAPFTL